MTTFTVEVNELTNLGNEVNSRNVYDNPEVCANGFEIYQSEQACITIPWDYAIDGATETICGKRSSNV